MILDFIILTAAILLGVLIYWRESRSNGIFRAYNFFINKKSTRMEASDRKGFFFLRPLQFRILNGILLAAIFGILIYQLPLITQHLEFIAAFFVGLIAGTYLAAALPAVKRAVDNPFDALQEVGQAGKEIVSDLSNAAVEKMKEAKEHIITETPEEPKETEKPKAEKQEEEIDKNESARDRMKRKGYLK